MYCNKCIIACMLWPYRYCGIEILNTGTRYSSGRLEWAGLLECTHVFHTQYTCNVHTYPYGHTGYLARIPVLNIALTILQFYKL